MENIDNKIAKSTPKASAISKPSLSYKEIKQENLLTEAEFLAQLDKLEKLYNNTVNQLEKKQGIHPGKALRCSKHRGNYQYHIVDAESGSKPTYCRVRSPLLFTLAQRDYNDELLIEMRSRLDCIKEIRDKFRKNPLEDIYEKRAFGLKKLIKPLFITVSEYVNLWRVWPYTPKEINPNLTYQITENGEKVRSKSELIIANSLKKKNIPYKYECPLSISGALLHPDFTVINPTTGKIYYWEHLGLMDDSGYREEAFKRIALYESAGLLPGRDLIITTETSKTPLSSYAISEKIRLYITG